jgi:hemoglobin
MGGSSRVAPINIRLAGGKPAVPRLAGAHHERCLADPMLNHPFCHPGHPEHVARLASYWAEVFGGPLRYSQTCRGHSAMLTIDAGMGGGARGGSSLR